MIPTIKNPKKPENIKEIGYSLLNDITTRFGNYGAKVWQEVYSKQPSCKSLPESAYFKGMLEKYIRTHQKTEEICSQGQK